MAFLNQHIVSLTLFLPLVGAAVVLCMPAKRRLEIRILSLAISAITLLLATKLFVSLAGSGEFEFEEALSWIPQLGISYRVGLDGMSMMMILLTTILVPVVIGCSWFEIREKVKAFHALLLLLEMGMIGTFAALDVFLFYVFWEVVLIPMYFIIGVWGSGQRIRSALKFVIFTTLGSVIMLVAILYCQSAAGGSFDLIHWYGTDFAPRAQLWLFAAFAFAFAIKMPLVPLHTWLPDAHTDAPTGGSILLAGVLLKMGAYGFYRLAMPLFPVAVSYATPYLVTLAVIAIIYGGLIALAQPDMKRLIAYSSIAHMGFVMLGLSSLEQNAVQGAALQMFNHGITTGALFMMVGMMHGRTRTRMIADYGGTARRMPLLATAFIVLALASAGLPGLSTFASEFLILLGSFQIHTYVTIVAVVGVIIAAVYMLWLIQRIFFGPAHSEATINQRDLTVREHLMIVPIIALIIAMGVWPSPWLSKLERSTQNYLKLAQCSNVCAKKQPLAPPESTQPSLERPQLVPTDEGEEFIESQEEGIGKPPSVSIPEPTIDEPTEATVPPSPPPMNAGKVELPELPPAAEESEEDYDF